MKPIRLYKLFLPLLLLGLVSACSPPVPPEEVASSFWAATLIDDQPAVRLLVVPDSFVRTDFLAARHGQMFDSVVIGQAEIDGKLALVDTRLEGVFYGEKESVQFSTVAVIHEGYWLIDYAATASQMIAAYLETAVDEVDQEMRDDVRVLEDSMNESIRRDLRDLTPRFDTPESAPGSVQSRQQ